VGTFLPRSAELKAFLDDFFARNMEEYHVAGAPSCRQGWQIGSLPRAMATPTSRRASLSIPNRRSFALVSVGKVLTWTAVMQLVEQGKLNLDADINTYLDFRIPDTYPQPVTLKHLMTHTSGFEDRWLESLVSDASELIPAREWLVSNTPGRVRRLAKLRVTRTTMPCWRVHRGKGIRPALRPVHPGTHL